jgi:hypothetical protein
MWTHSIQDYSKYEGQIRVVVVYSNGTVKYDKTYLIDSLDDIKRFIQGELNKCNLSDTVYQSLSKGPIDLTIPVVPVVAIDTTLKIGT